MGRVKIVAEISGNHSGSYEKACWLLDEAAKAGCDYVKFQYYKPVDMPWTGQDDHEMYCRLAVEDDWLPGLFDLAKRRRIGLFASVFSAKGAQEILKYDVRYIKIASPDSTKLGQETYAQIIACAPPDVDIIWSHRGRFRSSRGYKTLYCPLGHPPIITRDDFSDFRTGNYYGFSDHTPGIRAPLAFIDAGAEMIEKHFKLEGDDACVDAHFSADPLTMGLLCKLAHNR